MFIMWYTLLSYIQVDNICDVFSCEADDYVQANKINYTEH